MDLELKGKKVIVTGGSRGIGKAIAEQFAEEGCDVAICARNPAPIESCVDELKKRGINAFGSIADITDRDAFREWVDLAASELGGVDIFISNVSAISMDWEECVRTDILGMVNAVEAVLPHIEKSDYGSILAISSKAALLSLPAMKSYAASKAAIISYMSSLCVELAPKGIRVNTVSPGDVFFEGGSWDMAKQHDQQAWNAAVKRNRLGRLGTPEEIAKTVVFVSSPASSFTSGANVLVDGASMDHVQF